MDNAFTWHWFNDGTRAATCSVAIACYYPLSYSELLPAISEQHSLKNGGSHCAKCVSLYVEQTGKRDYDNAIGDCKNCGTNFADIPEKAAGFCSYCTDNDLMPAAVSAANGYKDPAIVAEVPRAGTLQPYRWNVNGVCVNPDCVYQAEKGKWDNLKLTAAQRPDGQWAASHQYNYSKGPGGSSGPVSLSGLGYDTKQDAVRAVAADLLLRPSINDLHPSLRAALAVVARSPGLLVAAPVAPRRSPAKPKRSLAQLDLFGGEAAA